MSFFNVINILSLLPHYNTIINSTFFIFFVLTSKFIIFTDVQKVQPKKKLTLQQQIEMRQNKYRNKRNGPVHATNEQNNNMTRGDVVTYDVVHDRRTGKLRCHNIRVLVDEENIM